MDIMSIANMATGMQTAKNNIEYSAKILKASNDIIRMTGEGAIALIESASPDGSAAAAAQGKGKIINTSA